jgi:hypothetical protein
MRNQEINKPANYLLVVKELIALFVQKKAQQTLGFFRCKL